ncbi:hypothetical protein [Sinorhizobium sp. A49]|uniref:hypothetical protein n=1 Tax=Sinorhizobium sp. A49 TaxID=1945861 RepID=UPI0011157B44|nr:hypothetical protein [Sinorhizobium sp. A49]
MAISYSDLPYSATPGGHADFHFQVLTIPFDDEDNGATQSKRITPVLRPGFQPLSCKCAMNTSVGVL